MAQQILSQLDDYAIKAVRSGVIVAVAAGLTFFVSRTVHWLNARARQLVEERGGGEAAETAKQASTVALVGRRLLVTLIWTLALAGVLDQFGLDVRPLLATAGVAGLAVGFAAQNILKDLIGGFFLLAEGQIRVNDVVSINGLSGVVEELSLRNTVLRGVDGAVHVISNGTITQLSNLTRQFSFAVFDTAVCPEQDPDAVAALLRRITEEMRSEDTYRSLILEPLEVMGLDKFTDQGLVVKTRIKTQAGKQWTVGREVNRRLKQRAAGEGVRLLVAQRVVLDAVSREELREIVRSVMADQRPRA